MKQSVILNQGSDIVVQNNEIVYDRLGGLKMGDIAGANFKTYSQLPELFSYAGEEGSETDEESIHLRLTRAGLSKGNTVVYTKVSTDGHVPLDQRASNVWYEKKLGGTWYYANKFVMGVMIVAAKVYIYESGQVFVWFGSGKMPRNGIDGMAFGLSRRWYESAGALNGNKIVYYGFNV